MSHSFIIIQSIKLHPFLSHVLLKCMFQIWCPHLLCSALRDAPPVRKSLAPSAKRSRRSERKSQTSILNLDAITSSCKKESDKENQRKGWIQQQDVIFTPFQGFAWNIWTEPSKDWSWGRIWSLLMSKTWIRSAFHCVWTLLGWDFLMRKLIWHIMCVCGLHPPLCNHLSNK